MREFERRVVLSVLDRKWREHLYEMDYLREGVSLRGYGQRDPLIEYQREGYDMFTTMMEGIKEESVTSLFNLQVQVQQDPIVEDAVQDEIVTTAPAVAPPPARQQAAQQRPAQQRPAQQRQARGGASAANGDAGDGETALPAGLARSVARPKQSGQLSYSAPDEDASGHAAHKTTGAGSAEYANVGRNAPCPCGSGKKFKQCHGDPRNR